jgi:hypothetical protein
LSTNSSGPRSIIRIFGPVARILISKARANILALSKGLGAAVLTVRALTLIGCGSCVQVNVIGKESKEHRARVARLKVERKSLVLVVRVHILESFIKIISVYSTLSGHWDDAYVSMITIVDKNVVVCGALEYSPATNSSGILSQNGIENIGAGLSTTVFNDASFIYIGAVRLVEDLPLDWVLRVVSNIVFGNDNNVWLGDTILLQNLICMAYIRLVTVVWVAVRAGYKDSPVSSIADSE